MKTSFFCSLAALAVLSANAWVFTPANIKKAASVATASAIIGGSALVSNAAVDLSGSYSDPFHPNCQRVISVNGLSTATLKGTDGNPGCKPGGAGKEWALDGKVDGNTILVDFSPKGGPKDLKGVWEGNGIRWPDGNKWTKETDSAALSL